MEAVIIHAQREEEANEWKKELEAKYPHVTIRTGYFGAVIGTHLGEGALGLDGIRSNKDIKALFRKRVLRIFYVQLTS